MDLRKLLEAALERAMRASVTGTSTRNLHAARSREWIASLAAGFQTALAGQAAVEVFWKGRAKSDRANFGRSEMLHDVLVCEVGQTPAALGASHLPFIRRAIWQIESEFARDSHVAMNDFVKLTLGSAEHKLFVGPRLSDDVRFINTLLPAAVCCGGELWLALVPHPDAWATEPPRVDLWQLRSGGWAAQ